MIATEKNSQVEELECRLGRLKADIRDLATMGTVITSILEIDVVLSVTVDMAIRLIDAEVGLLMIEENGELVPKVSWGVGESFVRSLKYEDDLDIVAYCYQNSKAITLSDLELKSDEGIVLDSVIACPIKTQEKCLGVMVAINKVNGGSFSDDNQEMLALLLDFVAVSVENSQLVKNKLKQQKIDQEMAIARQVQETILSDKVDDIIGANIGAIYFPAREVGGDFYDVIKLDDDNFIVIIGDVSSKGVPAALVMSACSGIIKTILKSEPQISISDLTNKVNSLMSEQIIKDREMFVTLFFSKFDLGGNEISYCNAGHMPGLLWKESIQSIIELPKGGPILGQFPDISYNEGSCSIESGDKLFLFTDGLTEATDINEELFGRLRAEQVFSSEIGLEPKEFCLKVKEWVDRFIEGAPEEFQDDFTILQVEIK